MTLGELLTLLRGSILNDRSDRVAGTPDYLWEDATLITYMNEAQRRFATKAHLLRDGSTPEVTQVTLVEGQTEYPLHEAVYAVISGKLSTARSDMARVGHALLNAHRSASDMWIDPSSYDGLPDGKPLAFSTDEELTEEDCGQLSRVTLRVYPAPSAAYADQTIQLRVLRKPIYKFDVNDLQASPEIPEDYHIEMLDYAAYLALRIVDDDAGSPKRAADFLATFEVNVREARNHTMRKLFAPQPWGFGKGGFSWEH